MGDWSDNLEYEQREHYGHFYDTDEDVHEEEETDDLISKQKVLNTLDFADNALTDEVRTVENYKALLTECIKVLPSAENKGDLISRQAVEELIKAEMPERGMWEIEGDKEKETVCEVCVDLIQKLSELPSVENKGEWIYDKGIYNWRCSRCGQTPPPTGYAGKADFMAKYFKFCNYCGCQMDGKENNNVN